MDEAVEQLIPDYLEGKNVELSVIVPIYNEEDNLDYLFNRLEQVLTALSVTYEIICVNDGSVDRSFKRLVEHHRRNPAIKVIDLSRNFGKETALTAGIDYSVGQVIVPIDADLQDPPELISDLLAKWREGYDVVYAVRCSREGETWLKKLTAHAFYRTLGSISKHKIPENTGDFRLMDRCVVEALKQLPEQNRFMKGLFSWVGFKQVAITYNRASRYKGQTTWNYWKLWNFALDGFTSFSAVPLKVWSYIGVGLSAIAFLYGGTLIIRTLIVGIDVPGYASLMVATLFLGGIQLISLGILGEYLGRIFEEVKERPLYFIRNTYGIDEAKVNESLPGRPSHRSITKIQ